MNPPTRANTPLRLVGSACLLGLGQGVAAMLFVEFHPLNLRPTVIAQLATPSALFAVLYGLLFTSACLVHKRRVMSWLLLVPAFLVLLVMSWGCLGHVLTADAALRVAASGGRYMNCGGVALVFAFGLSYLIAFAALVICLLERIINHFLFAKRISIS